MPLTGEGFVRDQGLQHAYNQPPRAPPTTADSQQAAMQIIAESLQKKFQGAAQAEKTAETQLREQLALCCLATHLLAAVYEHNMQTDADARCTVARKELAQKSLPPSLRPDSKLTGEGVCTSCCHRFCNRTLDSKFTN